MSSSSTTRRRVAMGQDRPARQIDVFARVSAADSDDGPGWALVNRHEGPGMTAERALREELAHWAADPGVFDDGLVFYDGDLLVGVLRVGARGPELIDFDSR